MKVYDVYVKETNDTVSLVNALSDACNEAHASCVVEYESNHLKIHVSDHSDSDVIASIIRELKESDTE